MRPGLIVMAVMLVVALAGCASGDWRRNVYEGLRVRNQALQAPGVIAAPPLNYDQYQSARRATVLEPQSN